MLDNRVVEHIKKIGKNNEICTDIFSISYRIMNVKYLLIDNILKLYVSKTDIYKYPDVDFKDIENLCDMLNIHRKTDDKEFDDINGKLVELIANGLYFGSQILLPFIIGNKSYSASPYISYTDLLNNNDNYTDDNIACIDPLYVSIVHSDNVFNNLENILNEHTESPIDALFRCSYLIGITASTVINKEHYLLVKDRLLSIMSKYTANDILLSHYVALCMTIFNHLVTVTKLHMVQGRLNNITNNIYFNKNAVYSLDANICEMYVMQKYFAQFDNTDIDSISLEEIYTDGINNTKPAIASKKLIIWSLDKNRRFNVNQFIKDNVEQGLIDTEDVFFYIYTRILLLERTSASILEAFKIGFSINAHTESIGDKFRDVAKNVESLIKYLETESLDLTTLCSKGGK